MYKLFFVLLIVASVGAAPFFDAIYDAIAGNGRRSYGYDNGYRGYDNGYRGYDNGYRGYNGYDNGYRSPKPKQGRTFKQLCRVHYPDSFGAPGAAGVPCPY